MSTEATARPVVRPMTKYELGTYGDPRDSGEFQVTFLADNNEDAVRIARNIAEWQQGVSRTHLSVEGYIAIFVADYPDTHRYHGQEMYLSSYFGEINGTDADKHIWVELFRLPSGITIKMGRTPAKPELTVVINSQTVLTFDEIPCWDGIQVEDMINTIIKKAGGVGDNAFDGVDKAEWTGTESKLTEEIFDFLVS